MRARKKYQVFISSTFEDLHHERQAITWALLKARFIPVGMEAFSATDDRGWKTITATIDDSDYYILVLAGKLGSVDESCHKSWTRKEYEYARAKGVPVLAFVRDQDLVTKDKLEHTPERIALLEDFIREVEANHHRERWTDQADLVTRVGTALGNHVQDDEHAGIERPGWFRGDQLPASTEALDELARLSKENADLRADLARQVGERPTLELWCQNAPVAELLAFRVDQVRLKASPGSTNPFGALASIRTGPKPEEVVRLINATVWLQFDLRNSGRIPARSLRIEVRLSPAVDVHVYPASMGVVPLRDKTCDSTAHVHVDRYHASGDTAVVVERMQDLNPGVMEQLVAFGVEVPATWTGTLDCQMCASDQGGALLDKRFKMQFERRNIHTIDEDRIDEWDAKIAVRTQDAT